MSDSQAPLTPAMFHVLLSLADGEKHGYAIMQETLKLSEGEFRIGPATLYTNIQRLLAADVIKEVSGSDAEPDARRRYYRLCRSGRTLIELELERMRKAVQPVVEKVSANLKPETVKLFNEELERVRKAK